VEGDDVKPENSRYDRSHVPEACWPDGVPVSNWSKAIAALGLTPANTAPSSNYRSERAYDEAELPLAA
jgi:hypothetical protein